MPPSLSATPDPDARVANGSVNAIATAADGTTYICGEFTHVGPNSGGGAPLDGDGKVAGALLRVDGTVSAGAPDGSGGFYNLAHIKADGTLNATRRARPRGLPRWQHRLRRR